jgi:hypothetical protein
MFSGGDRVEDRQAGQREGSIMLALMLTGAVKTVLSVHAGRHVGMGAMA